jgi:DNA-directed RNA polymerase subunit RPC12/RpoP
VKQSYECLDCEYKMCREEIVKVILKQIDDDSTTNNFEHSYWFICTGCLDEVEMVKKDNDIFECPDCKTEFVEIGGYGYGKTDNC